MSRAQQIRPSQFITSYGPGSILEGPEGPRVVLSLEHSGVFGSDPPRQYAIPEPNLASILGGSLVRVPSNAERNVIDTAPMYATNPFPAWSLCVAHNVLYRHTYDSNRTGCKQCPPHRHPAEATLHARREAIRFVVACRAGHLDDLEWLQTVRHQTPECKPSWLVWRRTGGSLEQVTLECPECHGQGTLGSAYYRDWGCSGRFPEQRSKERCLETARVINRAAANLHLPELISTVTIPRLDTTLHQMLASTAILTLLRSMQRRGSGPAEARAELRAQVEDGTLPPSVTAELDKYSDEVLARTIAEVLTVEFLQSEADARTQEFRELHRAALNGHPVSWHPGDPPPQLQIVRDQVREMDGLRIAPVSRLRVVMAQRGYRRLGSPEAEVVDVGWTCGADRWYPAVELLGEGLYIESIEASQAVDGEDAERWLAEQRRIEGRGDASDCLHPVFVWWHTFSHRILAALSLDSGYASASIRERVYFHRDPVPHGGVLLYTVQPGGDGTLGGLIALVPRFERILRSALVGVSLCSNDPLCGESRMAPGRTQGAICYACGMTSETSCELHNRYLDRRLLAASKQPRVHV
ncbi:MAG: DrmB family protein [Candidatus Xenobia bacterium]